MNLGPQYFRYIKWLMVVAGIWRIDIEEFSTVKKKLYHFYSVLIQVVCSSPMLSFMFSVPTLLQRDTAAAISSIGIIIIFVMIVSKMLMCQSRPIIRLLRLALQPDFQITSPINDDVRAICDWHINFDNKLISLLVGSATLVGFCIPIFGDVNCYIYYKQHRGTNITEKPVLLHYWYPFDKNKYYTFILIDQNIRPVIASISIAIIGAFVNSIIIFVRLQLKLLQYSFKNFDVMNSEGAHMLKTFCFKHQELIKYVEDLNESFKTVIFLEFLVSSISFASQIFQITLGVRPFFATIILTYTIIQLLTFAWSTNEIIIQSSELAKALFESNWYVHDSQTKTMVHIMMMRCQKPVCLRNGRFGVMDLDVGISNMSHARFTQRYFRYVKWLMIVAGIWRITIEEFSAPKRKLYHCYTILIQMVFSSPLISYILNVPILLKTDMPAAISTLGFITFFGVILTKMFMCQSKPIIRLLQLALQSEYQTGGPINTETKAIYEYHIRFDNYVISILFFGAVLMGLCNDVFGDIDCYMYFQQHRGTNITDKLLPLNYWYPFDKNKHYALVLLDQNVRAMLACLVTAIVNAFVNCIFIYVRLQLTLLQYNFRSFRELNSSEGSKMLKKLCVKHQDLIRYVQDLSGSFRTIIFLEYMLSSLSLGSQILQITLGIRPFFMFIMLTYTVIQLLIFSWTSNEIIIQSLELSRALFESDWYQFNSKTKVDVHVIMMRCQKPLGLRIGHFGVMDLNVGLSRLKLAYSYASIMTSGV
ncbi:uncharacterized protein LOC132700884 [Cylas formicarius]|uniref:uncharacterized protein LOC132700884 n=1 Tax=Cylas formicarius TaxID=197179 RepID=UPI0029584EF1|nr:uncharacterized protein LOC132700884 [Cylas formicarius]